MSFADRLSVLRIILLPVFVSCLLYTDRYPILRVVATFVFFVAVLSDFLDGLVARLKKEKSNIGTVLDPLADKLLLITSFISLYLLKLNHPSQFNIPLWLVLIVVSRDFIILLGIGILYFLKIEIPIVPSLWGKLTTFFQMLTIFFALLHPFIPYALLKLIWILTAVFTLISGIGYIRRGVLVLNKSG